MADLNVRSPPKLIATIGGVPIYADEECPPGTLYLLPCRNQAELNQAREILGDGFVGSGVVEITDLSPLPGNIDVTISEAMAYLARATRG